ncbi:MAG: CAP domain-containing protein [Bacteroidia bacterium]|nr:CAP domain-containing protein [Bacteroidia bacterium]
MKILSIILSIFIFSKPLSNDLNLINKQEAKLAFEYLQKIRFSPKDYEKELPFLRGTKISKQILRWNDTLAKVAEQKALDMSRKNYFSHTNKEGKGINILIHQAGYTLPEEWIKPKSSNYFESIAAGKENAIQSINLLLIDKGVPSLGHRKHLLGIGEFNEDLTDIGIGFAKGTAKSDYISYMCVIIAKKE